MQSKGYTLWIEPTGEAKNKFTNLIKKLAKENHAPAFIPHVTLLGDIEISEAEMVKKARELILGQKPFTIEMEQIDYEDYFFRTLFVRAKETAELMALNKRAREIFQIHDNNPFMPHLSLLYGIFPIETKEKIISGIGKDQSVNFKVSSLHLIKGGEIKDWQIIDEFPFTITPTSEVETY